MNLKEQLKKSLLKPWDVVIIILLILLSFLPIAIFSVQQAQRAGEQSTQSQVKKKEAVLRVDGKEIRTFDLSTKEKTYTYKYTDSDGDYNLIEIADGKIRIKEADCGDQICVRRGWASENGETIVCLPHKLVIEVKTLNGSDEDSLIY